MMKKMILILLMVLALSACGSTSKELEENWIISSNRDVLRIEENYMYMTSNFTENEITNLIEFNTEDQFIIEILNNEGETKSSTTIYDYDIVRITNINNQDKVDYFVRIVSDFS